MRATCPWPGSGTSRREDLEQTNDPTARARLCGRARQPRDRPVVGLLFDEVPARCQLGHGLHHGPYEMDGGGWGVPRHFQACSRIPTMVDALAPLEHVSPVGMFEGFPGLRRDKLRAETTFVHALGPWRRVSGEASLLGAAVNEIQRTRTPPDVEAAAFRQARAYAHLEHPHVPAHILSFALEEELRAEVKRLTFDPFSGSRLAHVEGHLIGAGAPEECHLQCMPIAGANTGLHGWSDVARIDGPIRQVATGTAAVHGRALVCARTMYTVTVLEVDDRSGGSRFEPLSVVTLVDRLCDVTPSPTIAGLLALATGDGSVSLVDLGAAGEAPTAVRTAEASEPSWHAVGFGAHPRVLWHATDTSVEEIDLRAASSSTKRIHLRGAHDGPGERGLHLGVEAPDRFCAMALPSAALEREAIGSSQWQVALATARSLHVVDTRFCRSPLVKYEEPRYIDTATPREPPLLWYNDYPRCILRLDRDHVAPLCYSLASRAPDCAAPPLPPRAVMAIDGAARCMELPLRGAVAVAAESRNGSQNMFAVDSTGALWRMELAAEGEDVLGRPPAADLAQGAAPGQPHTVAEKKTNKREDQDAGIKRALENLLLRALEQPPPPPPAPSHSDEHRPADDAGEQDIAPSGLDMAWLQSLATAWDQAGAGTALEG